MKRNPHLGSDFNVFLKEERIFDEAQVVATERVLSFQLKRGTKKSRLTKSAIAKCKAMVKA